MKKSIVVILFLKVFVFLEIILVDEFIDEILFWICFKIKKKG